MISLSGLAHVVIVLIVAGLIFWLLNWLIGYVGLPEPFAKIARIVLAIAAVLVCIAALLMLTGYQVFVP